MTLSAAVAAVREADPRLLPQWTGQKLGSFERSSLIHDIASSCLVDHSARRVILSHFRPVVFEIACDLIYNRRVAIHADLSTWQSVASCLLWLAQTTPSLVDMVFGFFDEDRSSLIAGLEKCETTDALKLQLDIVERAARVLGDYMTVSDAMRRGILALLDHNEEEVKRRSARCISNLVPLRGDAFYKLLESVNLKNDGQEYITYMKTVHQEMQDSVDMLKSVSVDGNTSQSLPELVPGDDILVAEHVVYVFGVPLLRSRNEKSIAQRLGDLSPGKIDLVVTDTLKRNFQSVGAFVANSLPVLIEGEAGCGKTALCSELSKLAGHSRDMITINVNETFDSRDLIGSYVCTDRPGHFDWKAGALTRAVQEGRWVVIEDIDLAPFDVISLLTPLLERRELYVPLLGKHIHAAPGFQLIATRTVRLQADGSVLHTKALQNAHLWNTAVLESPTEQDLHMILNQLFPNLCKVIDAIVTTFSKLGGINTSSELSQDVRSLGRQFSLRDLLKWCKRLRSLQIPHDQPPLSVREHIFRKASDVFCSLILDREKRRRLMRTIGSCWEIAAERIEFFDSTYTPEVRVTGSEVVIGDVSLVRSISTGVVNTQNFAHTSVATRLLERMASAVAENEPVLLVGETGVGKTSMVQYICQAYSSEMSVINMSQQSDCADLIGGFRPANARAMVLPLKDEFEKLFSRTWRSEKNHSYLVQVEQNFAEGHWVKVLQLFLKASGKALQKLDRSQGTDAVSATADAVEKARAKRKMRRTENGSEEVLADASERSTKLDKIRKRWDSFIDRVERLRQQIIGGKSGSRSSGDGDTPAAGLSFQFVEGVLVKAIRSGGWILLDEINLAPSDVLERLSGLLEGGSLYLLEKGDTEPVPRHPNFRLFACMNPANDAGKRDLPPSVRSRFTELFVDECESQSDIDVVVQHQIGGVLTTATANAVEAQRVASSIVEFYMSARQMAREAKLADGANLRPEYSLRTLCRALAFVRKTISMFGVLRALYEGLCMSFLTLLNRSSYPIMEQLIEKHVLQQTAASKGAVKSILGATPMTPGEKYVLFDGFWLETGPLAVQDPPHYIQTPSVREHLCELARVILAGRFAVLLQGPTSAGKTSMVQYIAARTGHEFVRLNNHEGTDLDEYFGSYATDDRGSLVFNEGLLVTALRKGYWLVLDELNLAPSDVLEALNRLLDDNYELFVPELQETIRPHPHFRLFATQNPPGAVYGGRKQLSRAFRNRFLELHVDDIPSGELVKILEQRCELAPPFCGKMVKAMEALQRIRQKSQVFAGRHGLITPRDLFRWAGRKPGVWQELADSGFLLLAERLRTADERAIVLDVVTKVFKDKRVAVDRDALLYGGFATETDETYAEYQARLESGTLDASLGKMVWSQGLIRLVRLVRAAIQYAEAVLLVGETGCGKTTVCQLLSALRGKKLHIINCHEHSEVADFLGGLRPVRNRAHLEASLRAALQAVVEESSLEDMIRQYEARQQDGSLAASTEIASLIADYRSLFKWYDGPLVKAMKNGDWILIDEINLAPHAVLERLNSVLETDRTLTLAEKSATVTETIVAHEEFRIFATMNPGDDFGKKELTPALRTRFTEIYVPAFTMEGDVRDILTRRLPADCGVFADIFIRFLHWMTDHSPVNISISVRDVLSWVDFTSLCVKSLHLSPEVSILHGAALVILDGYGTGAGISDRSIQAFRRTAYEALLGMLGATESASSFRTHLSENGQHVRLVAATGGQSTPMHVVACGEDEYRLQIGGFGVPSLLPEILASRYAFDAGTTAINVEKVVRAMQLPRAILLEGSPGVGKTSLVQALGRATGHRVLRVNISEQMDMMDLLGADVPCENSDAGGDSAASRFQWCDGVLLQALKEGCWIVLDELNLAAQSVLEGLNSLLDHRGEIFIPELGTTVKCPPTFRLFACQNPVKQGGGRKGLPKSFLNRFSRVYVDELTSDDYAFILQTTYDGMPSEVVAAAISLQKALHRHYFRLGNPWDFNLRDLFRFFDVVHAYDATTPLVDRLCDAGRVIFRSRLRCSEDRDAFDALFATAFASICTGGDGERLSRRPGVHFNTQSISVGDIRVPVAVSAARQSSELSNVCHFGFHSHAVEGMLHGVHSRVATLLTGSAGCGKSTLVRWMSTLCGQRLQIVSVSGSTDTGDLVGGYEQLNTRSLIEDMMARMETAVHDVFARTCPDANLRSSALSLSRAWNDLTGVLHGILRHADLDVQRDALLTALREWQALAEPLQTFELPGFSSLCEGIRALATSITGGEVDAVRFAWCDGPLTRAVLNGEWLLIDNVNYCPAAVLDRLNGLLEPHGDLVVNERVLPTGEVMRLVPHPNFRLFLAMNPEFGEISRAMRNRCIELHVDTPHSEGDRADVTATMAVIHPADQDSMDIDIAAVGRTRLLTERFCSLGIASADEHGAGVDARAWREKYLYLLVNALSSVTSFPQEAEAMKHLLATLMRHFCVPAMSDATIETSVSFSTAVLTLLQRLHRVDFPGVRAVLQSLMTGIFGGDAASREQTLFIDTGVRVIDSLSPEEVSNVGWTHRSPLQMQLRFLLSLWEVYDERLQEEMETHSTFQRRNGDDDGKVLAVDRLVWSYAINVEDRMRLCSDAECALWELWVATRRLLAAILADTDRVTEQFWEGENTSLERAVPSLQWFGECLGYPRTATTDDDERTLTAKVNADDAYEFCCARFLRSVQALSTHTSQLEGLSDTVRPLTTKLAVALSTCWRRTDLHNSTTPSVMWQSHRWPIDPADSELMQRYRAVCALLHSLGSAIPSATAQQRELLDRGLGYNAYVVQALSGDGGRWTVVGALADIRSAIDRFVLGGDENPPAWKEQSSTLHLLEKLHTVLSAVAGNLDNDEFTRRELPGSVLMAAYVLCTEDGRSYAHDASQLLLCDTAYVEWAARAIASPSVPSQPQSPRIALYNMDRALTWRKKLDALRSTFLGESEAERVFADPRSAVIEIAERSLNSKLRASPLVGKACAVQEFADIAANALCVESTAAASLRDIRAEYQALQRLCEAVECTLSAVATSEAADREANSVEAMMCALKNEHVLRQQPLQIPSIVEFPWLSLSSMLQHRIDRTLSTSPTEHVADSQLRVKALAVCFGGLLLATNASTLHADPASRQLYDAQKLAVQSALTERLVAMHSEAEWLSSGNVSNDVVGELRRSLEAIEGMRRRYDGRTVERTEQQRLAYRSVRTQWRQFEATLASALTPIVAAVFRIADDDTHRNHASGAPFDHFDQKAGMLEATTSGFVASIERLGGAEIPDIVRPVALALNAVVHGVQALAANLRTSRPKRSNATSETTATLAELLSVPIDDLIRRYGTLTNVANALSRCAAETAHSGSRHVSPRLKVRALLAAQTRFVEICAAFRTTTTSAADVGTMTTVFNELLEAFMALWERCNAEITREREKQESMFKYKERKVEIATDEEREAREMHALFPNRSDEYADLMDNDDGDIDAAERSIAAQTVNETAETKKYKAITDLITPTDHHLLYSNVQRFAELYAFGPFASSSISPSPALAGRIDTAILHVARDLCTAAHTQLPANLRTRLVVSLAHAGHAEMQTLEIASPSDPQKAIGDRVDLVELALGVPYCRGVVYGTAGDRFNPYHHASAAELRAIAEVVQRVRGRVGEILAEYPDHPVLGRLVAICERILRVPGTAALMTFVCGLELLLAKGHEWQEYASRALSIDAQMSELGDTVIRCRRMELEAWNAILESRCEQLRTKAVGDYVHLWREYLEMVRSATVKADDGDESDSKDRDAADEARIAEWYSLLDGYMQGAKLGDFSTRLSMLGTLRTFLEHGRRSAPRDSRLHTLYTHMERVTGNVSLLYGAYQAHVDAVSTAKTAPLMRRIKEHIRLKRWSDRNFYAIREATNASHRLITKVAREYVEVLSESIAQCVTAMAEKLTQGTTIAEAMDGEAVERKMDDEAAMAATPVEGPTSAVDDSEGEMAAVRVDVGMSGSSTVSVRQILDRSLALFDRQLPAAAHTRALNSLYHSLRYQLLALRPLEDSGAEAAGDLKTRTKAAAAKVQRRRHAFIEFIRQLQEMGLHHRQAEMPFRLLSTASVAVHAAPPLASCAAESLEGKTDAAFGDAMHRFRAVRSCLQNQRHGDLNATHVDRCAGFADHLMAIAVRQRDAVARLHDASQRLQSLRSVFANVGGGSDDSGEMYDDGAVTDSTAMTSQIQETVSAVSRVLVLGGEVRDLLRGTLQNSIFPHSSNGFEAAAFAATIEETFGGVAAEMAQLRQMGETSRFVTEEMYAVPVVHSWLFGELKRCGDAVFARVRALFTSLLATNALPPYIRGVVDDALHSLQRFDSLSTAGKRHPLPTTTAHPSESDETSDDFATLMKAFMLVVQRHAEAVRSETEALTLEDDDEADGERENDEDVDDDETRLLFARVYGQLRNIDGLQSSLAGMFSAAAAFVERVFSSAPSTRQSGRTLRCVSSFIDIIAAMLDARIHYLLHTHRSTLRFQRLAYGVLCSLLTKGFCSEKPSDDSDETEETLEDGGERSGFGAGEGQKDVSDEIENEDEVMDADDVMDGGDESGEKPEEKQERREVDDSTGVEVSTDFNGEMCDVKPDEERDDDNRSEKSETEEEDKRMGEIEDDDPNKQDLDERLWNNDDEDDENGDDRDNKENDRDTIEKGKPLAEDQIADENKETVAGDEDPSSADKSPPEKDEKSDAKPPTSGEEEENDENDGDEESGEAKEAPNIEEESFMDVRGTENDPNEKEEEEGEEEEMGEDVADEGVGDGAEDGENDENAGDLPDNLQLDLDDGGENDGENADESPEDGETAFDDPLNRPEEEQTGDDSDGERDGETEKEREEEPDAVGGAGGTDAMEEDESPEEENADESTENNRQSAADEATYGVDGNDTQTVQRESDEDQAMLDGGEDDSCGPTETDVDHQQSATGGELSAGQQSSGQQQQQQQQPPSSQTPNDRARGDPAEQYKRNVEMLDMLLQQNERPPPQPQQQQPANAENDDQQFAFVDEQNADAADQQALAPTDDVDDTEMADHTGAEEAENTPQDGGGDAAAAPPESFDGVVDAAGDAKDTLVQDEAMDNGDDDGQRDTAEVEDTAIDMDGRTLPSHIDALEDRRRERTGVLESGMVDLKLDSGGVEEVGGVQRTLGEDDLLRMREEVNECMQHIHGDPSSNEAAEGQRAWETLQTLIGDHSHELCEQLRLVLEPTLATKLQGDYKSGKRINMKKVIPYIASHYRKDKIWMRRTRPSKREYQVLLAIDDTESMLHSGCAAAACEGMALLAKALTQLEVGELAVMRFGETASVVHPFEVPFTDESGARVCSAFKFDQQRTDPIALMQSVSDVLSFQAATSSLANRRQSAGSGVECYQLVFILSDGNINNKNDSDLRQRIRDATARRQLLVFIILSQSAAAAGPASTTGSAKKPSNTKPITEWESIEWQKDPETGRPKPVRKSYMDTFPFPFYVVIEDARMLPNVIGDMLRQWFALFASSS